MSKERLRCCTALDISEWDTARGWQHRPVKFHELLAINTDEKDCLISAKTQLCVIFANANDIRKCESCRGYFINEFQMPKHWWSDSSRKSNGYFGCRVTTHHINSWVYFEIKQLEADAKYRWYKLNIFVRWDRSTNRTILLAFETPPVVASRFMELLATPDTDSLRYPFWFYPHVLSEVARIQESAVWAIRDQVRAVEKEAPPQGRPEPDYRHLHDIARHAIHVSETLDVATQTIKRMLARHEGLMQVLGDEDGSQEIHSQLQFYESFISSMRCRSASNEKRMVNEIQLAFNTVAQHDASTSVKIGLATQSDSVTMKSIAFVTLTFLPPTFVSAIFSMSFFDYSAESGWAISDKFWLYWAFAVPITILTAVAWHFLRRHSVVTSPKDEPKYLDLLYGVTIR
ncbi:hypothetical protein F4859DRAFT_184323 [Xylaria cf. heliscus]|nr:hypothetical protein F4859DRAFT_184323 [Xylaria cf. heliscus]